MPLNETLQSEYDLIKHTASFIDLDFMGFLQITGKDRTVFLHNILSQDIKSLEPGSGTRAMLLDATGKIKLDLDLFIFQESVLIKLEKTIVTKAKQEFEKYIIAEDVKVSDLSEELTCIAIQGPGAEFTVKQSSPEEIKITEEFAHQPAEFFKEPLTLIKRDVCGLGGFLLLLDKELLNDIKTAFKQHGLTEVSQKVLEIMRIENGILRYGMEMNEDMILSESGLASLAASETKGCYPGQEVIAKIETYGRLNRKVTGLLIDGTVIPEHGDPIMQKEEPAGYILNAVFSPKYNQIFALALIKKAFYGDGTPLIIEHQGNSLTALTTNLATHL